MEIYVEKIEKFRKSNKWSMLEFATKIGIATSTYFYIIRKKTTTFKTLAKVAKIMDVEEKDLLR